MALHGGAFPRRAEQLQLDLAATKQRLRDSRDNAMSVADAVAKKELFLKSEAAAIERKERELAAEIAVDQAAGRVPVLIGAGASSTRGAIQWARHAQSLGAAGVLIMPPFYGPTPADISVRHFAAISDACPILLAIGTDHNTWRGRNRGRRHRRYKRLEYF